MYYEPKEIGKRIRSLRKKREMTQDQLAKEVGVSLEHLGKLERGEKGASIDTLILFCNYFGLSLDYLVLGKVNTVMPDECYFFSSIFDSFIFMVD